jgi:hypothetical protein
MIGEHKRTPPAYESLFLNCPRCGLSIGSRRRWLAIEHCPRCLGRSGIPVTLFSSRLPVGELYVDGLAPGSRSPAANSERRGRG